MSGMKEIDGARPTARSKANNASSAASEAGQKVINLHSLLTNLRGLVDAGTILKMYEADRNDIEYLALLHEKKKAQPAEPRKRFKSDCGWRMAN